jgi:hypothetical protein
MHGSPTSRIAASAAGAAMRLDVCWPAGDGNRRRHWTHDQCRPFCVTDQDGLGGPDFAELGSPAGRVLSRTDCRRCQTPDHGRPTLAMAHVAVKSLE